MSRTHYWMVAIAVCIVLAAGCGNRQYLSDHWYVVLLPSLPDAGGGNRELCRREGLRRWVVDELVWKATAYPDDCVLYSTSRGEAGERFLAACGSRQPVQVANGETWVPIVAGLVRWQSFGVCRGEAVRFGLIVPIGEIRAIAERMPRLKSRWFEHAPDVVANTAARQYRGVLRPGMVDSLSGDPVVVVAAADGAEATAIALLEAGENPSVTDKGGKPLLLVACREGEPGLVRELINRGINPVGMEYGGISALGAAVRFRHLDVVELLGARCRFPRSEIERALKDTGVGDWSEGSAVLEEMLRNSEN